MRDIAYDVIQQAQKGDTQAFEQLYRHYAPGVYSLCLKMMGRAADAEDATQEVFVTLFHKLKSFRFEAALKTWIFRIAVNTALNLRKKRARIQDPLMPFSESTTFLTASPDVGAYRARTYQAALIASLLDRLSPDQKACLLLRSVEGLSYQEIATTLQININTVRSRIRRARRTLLAVKAEVMAGEL